jgi:hypothetical protein
VADTGPLIDSRGIPFAHGTAEAPHMSQDDQNRDRENQQGEDRQVGNPSDDLSSRATRGTSSDSQPSQTPSSDSTSNVDDTDETDEDRDDDDRIGGGANRRHNIG